MKLQMYLVNKTLGSLLLPIPAVIAHGTDCRTVTAEQDYTTVNFRGSRGEGVGAGRKTYTYKTAKWKLLKIKLVFL